MTTGEATEQKLLLILGEIAVQKNVGATFPLAEMSFADEITQIRDWILTHGEYGIAFESMGAILEGYPFTLTGPTAVKLLEVGVALKYQGASEEDRLIDDKRDAHVELQKKIHEVADYWEELVKPFGLNEVGRNELGKLLEKYGLPIILDAMKVGVNKHVQIKDGQPTEVSVNLAWRYIARVASVKVGDHDNPHLKDIFYIRGILKNRLHYCNEQRARLLLEEAVEAGADIESLKKIARNTRNWTMWQQEMQELIGN